MKKVIFLFVFSIVVAAGCSNPKNVWERHERANELDEHAGQARKRNDPYLAAELKKKADRLRDKKIIEKTDIEKGILSGIGHFIYEKLFGEGDDIEPNTWP